MSRNYTKLVADLSPDKMMAQPLPDGSGRMVLNTQPSDGTNVAGFGTAAVVAAAAGTPSKAQAVVGPGGWTAHHAPTTATQATIAQAAGATGVQHVCTSITATVACGATAQTPLNVYLRDGTTGAGTILWAASIAAPADGSGLIQISDIQITGSAATAMTLEFSAAGVAASLEAVSMTGYDVS